MKKILIADDSATLRAVLRNEIEKNAEYEVFEAKNGSEALEMVVKLQPDLLTLDIWMPDMDGYQVCTTIRSFDSDLAKLPVIFLTSADTMESRQRGHRVGGNDFIIKPFVSAELQSAISKQLYKKNELQGASILVVDDSPLVRQILAGYLAGQQIELIHAGCGEEALGILRENFTTIDAVITDYNMPGLNGEGLCRAIRQDIGDLDLPVIFITSKREIGNQLFAAGATDYLQKPFTREELLARVRIHLRPMMVKRFLYETLIDVKKLTRAMEQKNALLKSANETIEQKTLELTEDLIVASEFQQKYFGNCEVPDFLELALYYQPMSYVSGDFYMVRKNHSGACNILIGDVAGHGIGPAFVTMVAKTLLDRVIDGESLCEMMQDLNRDVEQTIPSDRYLTSVLLRICEDGQLTLANAGHPGIILLPADGSPRISIKPEGTPLGMFDGSIAFFDTKTVKLNPGDKLVLFTDGLIEQRNKKGQEYGMQRFEKSLDNSWSEGPEALIKSVIADFGNFVGTAAIDDDQTLIVVKYR